MANPPTVTVYDLDNKPHHMTPANARDMIQHNKWSTTPVDRTALAKAQAQREELLSQAAASTVDTSAIEQELNGKSKAEMVALALDRYGEKLDGRKSEADIIKAIIELAQIAGSNPADEDDDQTDDETDDDDQTDDDGETAQKPDEDDDQTDDDEDNQ
jgi:hypothetical protein